MGVLLGDVHPSEQERLNNLVPQRGLNSRSSDLPSVQYAPHSAIPSPNLFSVTCYKQDTIIAPGNMTAYSSLFRWRKIYYSLTTSLGKFTKFRKWTKYRYLAHFRNQWIYPISHSLLISPTPWKQSLLWAKQDCVNSWPLMVRGKRFLRAFGKKPNFLLYIFSGLVVWMLGSLLQSP